MGISEFHTISIFIMVIISDCRRRKVQNPWNSGSCLRLTIAETLHTELDGVPSDGHIVQKPPNSPPTLLICKIMMLDVSQARFRNCSGKGHYFRVAPGSRNIRDGGQYVQKFLNIPPKYLICDTM